MSLSQEPGLFVNSSAGVDSSNFVGSITEALSVVKPLLQQAAGNDQLFAAVFGEKANTIEFQTIRGQWKIGDFSQLPSVQVISAADMNGADGAYASSTQTIYLSDGLFSSGAESVGSMLGAAGVLVEESFHWLDAHVGADSKGDEGELARNLVFGVQLSAFELTRIRSEDDRGFITVNGQQEQVAVEMDLVSSLANTLQTAKNIGVLGSTSQIFTGFVGDSVRDNYIRFQVTTPSIFAVELSGLTKDANVRLLNDQGGFIQASYNKGTAIDAFQYQLGVGTYYVHVYREALGDNTNYSLKMSAPPVSTVVPNPFIKVTSPNGFNSIARGSVINITWQDNIAENVRIDLYKAGVFYQNITSSTPSNGSFTWSVPSDVVANTNSSTPNWVSLGNNYDIRVRSVMNSAIFDRSDVNFSITGKTSNDLLGTTLVVAQGVAKAGDTVNISYAVRNDGSDATTGFKVGFYLSNDPQNSGGDLFLGEANVSGLGAKSTSALLTKSLVLPNQGNAFWKGDKGYFIKAIADYKNVIIETNEANNYGQILGNDYGAISVTGTVPPPKITVTSPNGGYSIVRGSLLNISWQDNFAEDVRIDLYKGGQFYRNITQSTPSNGRFIWSVPTDIVANTNSSTPNWVSIGSDYQVRVQSVTNPGVFDASDSNFAIVGKKSNDLFGTTLALTQNIVRAGDIVNVSYAVRNDGTDATAAFKVGFYLSNDPQSKAGDLFLGEADVSGLAAKSTSATLKTNLVLPGQGNAFWKGDKGYFIKAVADYKNVISETNEANNYSQVLWNDYSTVNVTGTALVPVIPDNTQSTARDIGTLTKVIKTFDEFVGSSDKEDWYTFYIAEPGTADISITSDNGATLEFYKDSSMLSRSSTGGNLVRSEYINEPGKYFIRISQNYLSPDTNYRLSLSTTSSVADLGTLSGTRSVAVNNNISYYRFKLDRNSVVTASSNFPNAVSLDVRDNSYSKTVGIWLNNGALLNAGTYYLAVSRIYGSGADAPASFTLNLQATPTSRYDNGGLDSRTAFDLGTITTSKGVTDFIDANDKRDYFSFTVDLKSSVSLDLAAITGKPSVQVYLYDSQSNYIARVDGFNGTLKPLVATLEAGKYYVQIIPSGLDATDVQYRLNVNVQSLVTGDAIGNSYDQIKDLGYLAPNTPVTLRDAIGGSDPADWMKFNISTLGNVSTAFSGLTTPITLQLSRIEANGSLTAISTQNSGGQANWTPVFSNLVGNYALVVSSGNVTSTPYTLNLSTISTNVAPTNVKWNFSGTYQSNQDVVVTGSAFDANGVLDLDEAKFYLQSKDGSFRQTFSTKNFTQSSTDSRVANFSINLGRLPVGQYVYQSDVYDKSRAPANTGTTIYLNGGYAAEVVYTAANSSLQVAPEILPYYSALSPAQQNKLGAPLSPNASNTNGTWRQDFQGGNIIAWAGSTPMVSFNDGSKVELPNSLIKPIATVGNMYATGIISSSLSISDFRDRARPDYFADDYLLIDTTVGQMIKVTLTSNGFVPKIFLVDASNGSAIAQSVYMIDSNKTELEFQVFAGQNYIVRITSQDQNAIGDYMVATMPVTINYPVNPKPAPTPTPSKNPVIESVDEKTAWRANIFQWNRNTGSTPPVNFYDGDSNNPNWLGTLNLGPNNENGNLSGSMKFDWGTSSAAFNSQLPADGFAIRAYTWADFDGSSYNFTMRGDDGYQILAKNQATGEWFYITPKDQWQTQGYGVQSNFSKILPAGRYDLHFHYFEYGGEAKMDLSWNKGTTSNPVSSGSALSGTVITNLNIRTSASASATSASVGGLNANQSVTVDAWTYGGSYSAPNNTTSNLWYRIAGTSNWVAGAYITGISTANLPQLSTASSTSGITSSIGGVSSGQVSQLPSVSIISAYDTIDKDNIILSGGSIWVSGKAKNAQNIQFYLDNNSLAGSITIEGENFYGNLNIPSVVNQGSYQLKAVAVNSQGSNTNSFGTPIIVYFGSQPITDNNLSSLALVSLSPSLIPTASDYTKWINDGIAPKAFNGTTIKSTIVDGVSHIDRHYFDNLIFDTKSGSNSYILGKQPSIEELNKIYREAVWKAVFPNNLNEARLNVAKVDVTLSNGQTWHITPKDGLIYPKTGPNIVVLNAQESQALEGLTNKIRFQGKSAEVAANEVLFGLKQQGYKISSEMERAINAVKPLLNISDDIDLVGVLKGSNVLEKLKVADNLELTPKELEISGTAKFVKWGGRVLVVASVAYGVYEIYEVKTLEEKVEKGGELVGGFVGGAAAAAVWGAPENGAPVAGQVAYFFTVLAGGVAGSVIGGATAKTIYKFAVQKIN